MEMNFMVRSVEAQDVQFHATKKRDENTFKRIMMW